jgi:hypothetical protein
MRYRVLSSTGDMQFGRGQANFYINNSASVAQLIQTRLGLWAGEWYLDLTQGTPWATQVLGHGTSSVYDSAIRAVILGTTGVTGIASYSSSLNPTTRRLTINATVNNAYGPPIQITAPLSLPG